MCSHEICLMLKEQWGGACSELHRRTNRGRKMWGWDVSGRTAIPVLEYMATNSLTKREQASLALQIIATFSVGTTNEWGSKGMPKEVREMRESLAQRISALNKPVFEVCVVCGRGDVVLLEYPGGGLICVTCQANEHGEGNG